MDSSKITLIATNSTKSYDIGLSMNVGKNIDSGADVGLHFAGKLPGGRKTMLTLDITPMVTTGRTVLPFNALGMTKELTIVVGSDRNTLDVNLEKIATFESACNIADVTDGKMWMHEYDVIRKDYAKSITHIINLSSGKEIVYKSSAIRGVSKDYVATSFVDGAGNKVTKQIRIYRKNDAKLMFILDAGDETVFQYHDEFFVIWQSGNYLCFISSTRFNGTGAIEIFATLDTKREKFRVGSSGIKLGKIKFFDSKSNELINTSDWIGNDRTIKVDIKDSKLEYFNDKPAFFSILDEKLPFIMQYSYPDPGQISFVNGMVVLDNDGKQLWSKSLLYGFVAWRLNSNPLGANNKYLAYITYDHEAFREHDKMFLVYDRQTGRLLFKKLIDFMVPYYNGDLFIESVVFDGQNAYMTVEHNSGHITTAVYRITMKGIQ